jgi:hypothetical protein
VNAPVASVRLAHGAPSHEKNGIAVAVTTNIMRNHDRHDGLGPRALGESLPVNPGFRVYGGTALRQRSGKFPKNYRRSDERIREDICDELGRTADIDPSDVDVIVVAGEVRLEGTVTEAWMKYQIEHVCDLVPGVRAIRNDVRVVAHE